jgi:archaellum component FlaF (FlaF/FlaG flagellin family)
MLEMLRKPTILSILAAPFLVICHVFLNSTQGFISKYIVASTMSYDSSSSDISLTDSSSSQEEIQEHDILVNVKSLEFINCLNKNLEYYFKADQLTYLFEQEPRKLTKYACKILVNCKDNLLVLVKAN